jgi:hypothetical protein
LDEKGAAGMELTIQERKKFTMVKAQAYLKAGKAKTSVMVRSLLHVTQNLLRSIFI